MLCSSGDAALWGLLLCQRLLKMAQDLPYGSESLSFPIYIDFVLQPYITDCTVTSNQPMRFEDSGLPCMTLMLLMPVHISYSHNLGTW